jgi:cytochrome c biogenesis factor
VIELKVIGLGESSGPSAKSELLVVEVSVKPFMSLVWAGAFLMIVGLGIALATKFNGVSARQTVAGKNKSKVAGEGKELETKEYADTK